MPLFPCGASSWEFRGIKGPKSGQCPALEPNLSGLPKHQTLHAPRHHSSKTLTICTQQKPCAKTLPSPMALWTYDGTGPMARDRSHRICVAALPVAEPGEALPGFRVRSFGIYIYNMYIYIYMSTHLYMQAHILLYAYIDICTCVPSWRWNTSTNTMRGVSKDAPWLRDSAPAL